MSEFLSCISSWTIAVALLIWETPGKIWARCRP